MIQGERLRLRPRKREDLLREVIWSADPEVQMFDPPAGKVFNSQLFSIETLEGRHIGTCGVYNRIGSEGQVGIRIGDKDYWGKGYGPEAVHMLINHCFAVAGLSRIWLKVLPQNTRAIRCYEKCGFTECGKIAVGGYEFIMMELRR